MEAMIMPRFDFKYPTSDPEEARLRQRWHDTVGTPEHAVADRLLSNYLWKRTEADIAEDRRKHPKAKRNLPVGYESSAPTRNLP